MTLPARNWNLLTGQIILVTQRLTRNQLNNLSFLAITHRKNNRQFLRGMLKISCGFTLLYVFTTQTRKINHSFLCVFQYLPCWTFVSIICLIRNLSYPPKENKNIFMYTIYRYTRFVRDTETYLEGYGIL